MSVLRVAVLLWGVLGALAPVISAVYRLFPMTLEGLTHPALGGAHLAVGVLWVGFMAYGEGYRGFQLRFSPMVVARALHVATHPRALHVLLAPIFCMGLMHATPRRLRLSWGITLGIVVLVMIVRQFPQPWRGVIDAGVVVGLTWGVLATLVIAVRALQGHAPGVSPELPQTAVATPLP